MCSIPPVQKQQRGLSLMYFLENVLPGPSGFIAGAGAGTRRLGCMTQS